MAGGNNKPPKAQQFKRKRKRPYVQFATGGAAAGAMKGGASVGTSMAAIRKSGSR